jgi:SAM-dependent methyltransferase
MPRLPSRWSQCRLVAMKGRWLADVRYLELERVRAFLPSGGRLLDFGAGSGEQALRLQELGFQVEAVDLASSAHLDAAVFHVVTYDGRTLPHPDAHFDAVLSSNVLEHVSDLAAALSELARVSKPGATMLHIMPSASWRLWTSLAEFAAAPRNAVQGVLRGPDPRRMQAGMSRWRWTLLQLAWPMRPFVFRPHGARGCALTELWAFSRAAWARRFRQQGYVVVHVEPLRFWYTGEALLGVRLSPACRTRMSAWLGSASVLYVIRASSQRGNA